jgi:hypothetical protein
MTASMASAPSDVGDDDDARGAIRPNDEQKGVSGRLGVFSWRPAADEGAHQDAKIEACDVDQITL